MRPSWGFSTKDAVARTRFPGDSPPEVAGAVRGFSSQHLASSTLLHLHPFFRAHLRTQVPGNALYGWAGESHGLVMPVSGDFTAVLQKKKGSNFTRH